MAGMVELPGLSDCFAPIPITSARPAQARKQTFRSQTAIVRLRLIADIADPVDKWLLKRVGE